MKFSLLVLLLSFLSFNDAEAQDAVTIPHSKNIKLYSSAIQDTFSISIAVPESYPSGTKKYPVLYVTDPFFVYGSTVESARAHVYDGRMPETIIVGIGYTGPQKFRRIMQLRTRDYTPTDRFILPNGVEPEWAKEMELGNAQEFLRFIRDNLFTYMEENYRVTDDRTYIGHSGGGWYGQYILFNEPELFNRYLISSAGYWFEADRKFEGNLFEYEENYAADNDSLDVDLFLSVGDSEAHFMIGGMARMVQQLKARNYRGLRLSSHIFSDQTHYSVWPVAVNKGLLMLFKNQEAQVKGGLNKIDK